MKKQAEQIIIAALLLLVLSFVSCSPATASTEGAPVALRVDVDTALWANSIIGTTEESFFQDVATDSDDNTIAVGYLVGSQSHDFGNSVKTSGSGAEGKRSPVLAKYSADGVALWAKSTILGSSGAVFSAVSTDFDGNIYVVGATSGKQVFDFGNGISVKGLNEDPISTSNPDGWNNFLLVKYNRDGEVQWARSQISGDGRATLDGVATDRSGNIYVIGYLDGLINFGNGLSLYSDGCMIAKFDASGTALWARSVDGIQANYKSPFRAIECDSVGNLLVVGSAQASGWVRLPDGLSYAVDFGNGVVVSSPGFSINTGSRPFLVKFSAKGEAIWATMPTTGYLGATFADLEVDYDGNAIIVGSFPDYQTIDMGNTVSLTAASRWNPIVVKYSSSGKAIWARTLSQTAHVAEFYGVGVSRSGRDIYAVGITTGPNTYYFGGAVVATGTGAIVGNEQKANSIIVRYDENGGAMWAQTITAGTLGALYSEAAVSNSGLVHAVGGIVGTEEFGFGKRHPSRGSSEGWNALIVTYQ